ncbi:tachykinin-like peptides receptor 86C [Acanthaster planci]|uniref:Tachykinin-like peptides receptor 86C n=1 Tax=Acanthaster planci TaxID=133434 RepID=A0A8B7XJ22_ACAPL|nr:tachykinin-like peptides receptor 86C [Acanthaster planci]XP_022080132.1 tachykinin-like peptides receptor 86C [Acanthaster planci]XP_022080133.1 tachykinin-like peptides receptor 86C [Acanthaster planci]XP_022080134.1 tachykinin-like peptides receptor 86C [Acanthaster planci]
MAFVVEPIELNWKTILRIIFATVGIVGNAVVVTVYARKRGVTGRRTGRRLPRSATDTFILNLACADLLTSINIIPRPYLSRVENNALGHTYCRLINSDFFLWTSIVASIFTLTFVSVERFLAIVYPLKYRRLFSGNRARTISLGIWLLSLTLNTFNIYCVSIDPVALTCISAYPSASFQKFVGAGLFIAEFFIPMIVMIVAHVLAIRALRAHARTLLSRNESPNSPAYSLLHTRRKVIEMLLAVVVTFILCWSGDQVLFLAYNLGTTDPDYLSSDIYQAFFLVAFVNSCANPIIYTFKNQKFRLAVKGLIICRDRPSNRVSDVSTLTVGVENGLSQITLINALFLTTRGSYPEPQVKNANPAISHPVHLL